MRVLDQPHSVERLAQVTDLRWRMLAGADLGAHRIERGDDFRIPGRVVTERVPECLVVGDEVREHGVKGAERVGLVEPERVARGVGAVAKALPNLALLVLITAEEDGFRSPAADQHDHRFRFGKTGEVPEVAVEAVGMVRVTVAHAFRRCRDDGDAVPDLLEQFGAACRVGFVFHWIDRDSWRWRSSWSSLTSRSGVPTSTQRP